MRKLSLMLGAALALFATAPLAAAQHAHGAHGAQHDVQTNPADGAMGAAPARFSASFPHPARLTAQVVTPRGRAPIAVPVPALAVPDMQVAEQSSVALPQLAPGNYTFQWTATGQDGHVMTGRVRYMVH